MPNDIALKIENLSKKYRLGLVGTNTLRGDLQAWWYRMRSKEDPRLKIGEENKPAESGGKHIWALQDINFEQNAMTFYNICKKIKLLKLI